MSTTMSLSPKPSPLPGFTALSDQIHLRKGDISQVDSSTSSSTNPNTILIYAWGDANPKHVAKYVDGFLKLFPTSKIIVVLSHILKAMTRHIDQRVQSMRPIIPEIASPDSTSPHSTLVHIMSNTGGISFAATLEAYKREFNKPFSYTLATLDSTPSTVHYSFANVKRFSYAVALGVARFFPWPFLMTQSISAIFLLIFRAVEILLGRESAGGFSVKTMNNVLVSSKAASRVYLYSKEDKIIWWEDVEAHAAEATRRGYVVECVLFEGSGHVGHMRVSPEKYWGTILRAWRDATGVKN